MGHEQFWSRSQGKPERYNIQRYGGVRTGGSNDEGIHSCGNSPDACPEMLNSDSLASEYEDKPNRKWKTFRSSIESESGSSDMLAEQRSESVRRMCKWFVPRIPQLLRMCTRRFERNIQVVWSKVRLLANAVRILSTVQKFSIPVLFPHRMCMSFRPT